MSKLSKEEIELIEARLRALPEPDLTDPDNPEWTEADFARAISVDDLPADEREILLAAFPQTRRGRGPNKKPTKVPVYLRVDAQVLESYRATGPGWQKLMNADLTEAAAKRRA